MDAHITSGEQTPPEWHKLGNLTTQKVRGCQCLVFLLSRRNISSAQGSLKQGGTTLIIFILKGVRPVVYVLVQFSQIAVPRFYLGQITEHSSVQFSCSKSG